MGWGGEELCNLQEYRYVSLYGCMVVLYLGRKMESQIVGVLEDAVEGLYVVINV